MPSGRMPRASLLPRLFLVARDVGQDGCASAPTVRCAVALFAIVPTSTICAFLITSRQVATGHLPTSRLPLRSLLCWISSTGLIILLVQLFTRSYLGSNGRAIEGGPNPTMGTGYCWCSRCGDCKLVGVSIGYV